MLLFGARIYHGYNLVLRTCDHWRLLSFQLRVNTSLELGHWGSERGLGGKGYEDREASGRLRAQSLKLEAHPAVLCLGSEPARCQRAPVSIPSPSSPCDVKRMIVVLIEL